MQDWTMKEATQDASAGQGLFLHQLYNWLARPPLTDSDTEDIGDIAAKVYDYVWQRSASRQDLAAA
jgi:hypothetical protein